MTVTAYLCLKIKCVPDQACDDLANLWEMKNSPPAPVSDTALARLPAAPAVDPSPTVTPTRSPSFFAGIQNKKPPNTFHNFDERTLSAETFQTPQRESVSNNFQKPTCSATQPLAVHQKTTTSSSLMALFD